MLEQAPWKRQALVIWIMQFLSIVGFCIGLPFAAFHIQSLGVSGDDVVWWNTVFAVSAPICFFFSAPFWGIMADRFGRKKMLVRANVCAALVLVGMGWSPDVYWLIFFRIGQGLFTGVMPAAQTLMAVSIPQHRQGMMLGSLAAAVAAGVGIGSSLGGRIAEAYGYDVTFYIGAGISFLSLLVVLFGAKEHHDKTTVRTTKQESRSAMHIVIPILLLMALCSLMSHIDSATFPLLIQQLNGGIVGSAKIVGDIGAIAGISFAVGGTLWGWCADRFGAYRMLFTSAVCAAICSLPMLLVYEWGINRIYLIVLCFSFAMSGVDPVLQVLMSKGTSAEMRGRVFGWAATARSFGWMCGPILGSYIAVMSDFAQVYWVRIVVALCMLPIMVYAYRISCSRGNKKEESHV